MKQCIRLSILFHRAFILKRFLCLGCNVTLLVVVKSKRFNNTRKKQLIFQKNEPFWNAPIQPASAGDLVEFHDQKLEEVTTQGSKYSCNFFPHPNTLSNVFFDMQMETNLISPFENLRRSIFCGVSDLVIAKQCGYVSIGVFISAETLRAKY